MSNFIVPRFKLMLSYDVLPETQETYFRYVTQEMVPAMQEMGVYMHMAWHVVYGNYPMRHVEFLAESEKTVMDMFASNKWSEMEEQLMRYTTNYTRKLVRYRSGFQM